MKSKVIFLVSEVNRSHHLEWLILQLKSHCHFQVILIGDQNTDFGRFLESQNIHTYLVRLKPNNKLKVAFSIFKILRREKPHIIHTHFWLATLLGIPISYVLGISNRITTRHHGNLHHLYFKKGVWIDRLINALSTHIISPSENIKKLLVKKEYTNANKIYVINHGIDLNYYSDSTLERKELLHTRHGIPHTYPIVGIISRWVNWKGIQYTILAFEKLLKEYPTAHLVLANANGDFKNVIDECLDKLPRSSYTIINYENDIASLYAIFDIFVHVPIDLYSESFGLIYIEALAMGKPCIFTLSGVAPDFILDRENALVVDYKNEKQIASCLKEIISNKELSSALSTNGRRSVLPYSAEAMGEKLRQVYDLQ